MKTLSAIFGIFVALQSFPNEGLSKSGLFSPGDMTVGGLFNVHEYDDVDAHTSGDRCGRINPQYGIMYVEAMLFAVDQINRDNSFLFGKTLGFLIQDTCGDKKRLRKSLRKNDTVCGFIGPRYFARIVASQFGSKLKTAISYSTTSGSRNGANAHKSFWSVPSENDVVQLLVNLAIRFKWTYVAVISSVEDNCQHMSNGFRKYAKSHGICTPVERSIRKDSSKEDFLSALSSIMEPEAIRVVFLFLRDFDLTRLLAYAEDEIDEYKHLTFVLYDQPSINVQTTKGKSLLNGSLVVQVDQGQVPEFREYFLHLRPENNTRNVWFKEFWESQFNCSLRVNSSDPPNCTGKETLQEGRGYYKDAPVLAVINAVYAYAHAFRNALMGCQAKICASLMRMPGLIGISVSEQLPSVHFGEPYRDRKFHFNQQGQYGEDFAIFNWIMDDDSKTLEISKVGKWKRLPLNDADPNTPNKHIRKQPPMVSPRLYLNTNLIKWKSGGQLPPVSVCSKPCLLGQVKKYFSKYSKCCWRCISCSGNDIVRNEMCLPCKKDYVPDATRLTCKKLPVRYPGMQQSIVKAISCSICIGLSCTIFVTGLFLKHFNKRIVRESGRELCLNMLIGIAATYITPVLYIVEPSSVICSLQRSALSLSLTMSYAPLLLKINRIYRIFQSAKTSAQRPAMVRPKSQILLSLALTAVSLLIGCVSLAGSNANINTAYPSHREYMSRYCELSSKTVFLNLSYNTALMIATTWFAFKTRHFPRNYNEAKYIGFTMYTTCLVLAVLFSVFCTAEDKTGVTQIIIMCCICELIATINLLGLFGQKVVLMLGSRAGSVHIDIAVVSYATSSVEMNARGARPTSNLTDADNQAAKEETKKGN